MLFLDIIREGDELRVVIQNPGETICDKKKKVVRFDTIKEKCHTIFEKLNRSGQKGDDSHVAFDALKYMGVWLCNQLLTPEHKSELKDSRESHLMVRHDDNLVHIPWELLCLEDAFLCQRFSMGRIVHVQKKYLKNNRRPIIKPFKALILPCSSGNLSEPLLEAQSIIQKMDMKKNGNHKIINGSINSGYTPSKLQELFHTYDFIHFAGHAEYYPDDPGECGWILQDGIFKADDIQQMQGGAHMPFLVFSNACQSARTLEWETDIQDKSFGLANSFLLAGVKHYIGTSWEINDKSSRRFAEIFYTYLFSGRPIGESVRLARQVMIEEGTDTCWASYVLYGDPSKTYFDDADAVSEFQDAPEKSETNKIISTSFELHDSNPPRTRTPTPTPPNENESFDTSPLNPKNSSKWKIPAFAVLAVIVFGFSLLTYYKSGATPDDEWTTRPAHISVVYDKNSPYAEIEDMIAIAFEMEILSETRFKLVDRMTWEMSQAEHDIFKEEEAVFEVDLLPANIRLLVKANYADIDPMVQFRLIDNATTQLLFPFVKPFDDKESILSQRKILCRELLEKLVKQFPLRGKIAEIYDNNEIKLNIGADVGVQLDQRFRIIDNDTILKVVSISKDECKTVRIDGKSPFHKHMNVEAI